MSENFPGVFGAKPVEFYLTTIDQSIKLYVPSLGRLTRKTVFYDGEESTYGVVFSWDRDKTNIYPQLENRKRHTFLNNVKLKKLFRGVESCYDYVSDLNDNLIKNFITDYTEFHKKNASLEEECKIIKNSIIDLTLAHLDKKTLKEYGLKSPLDLLPPVEGENYEEENNFYSSSYKEFTGEEQLTK